MRTGQNVVTLHSYIYKYLWEEQCVELFDRDHVYWFCEWCGMVRVCRVSIFLHSWFEFRLTVMQHTYITTRRRCPCQGSKRKTLDFPQWPSQCFTVCSSAQTWLCLFYFSESIEDTGKKGKCSVMLFNFDFSVSSCSASVEVGHQVYLSILKLYVWRQAFIHCVLRGPAWCLTLIYILLVTLDEPANCK